MKMTIRYGLILLGMMSASSAFAQLPANIGDLEKSALQTLAQNPDLVNNAASKALAVIKQKNPPAYTFIRDLNLKFKTFQAGNLPPGLGFSYQYDNSWTNNVKNGDHIFSQSFNLDFDGNVAFKKVYNPVNFLESKFVYSGVFIWGGSAKKNTPDEIAQLHKADNALFDANDAKNAAQRAAALDQGAKYVSLSNQYFVGLNGNVSYESNQDFSKTQFVPGILLNVGIKPWRKDGALRWFNLPDYPFALLRWLSGTDTDFELSRASFPSALFGLDYVLPGQDSLRKAVTGTLDPFTRVRFEGAFKTKAAVVLDQVIWFSADYRWYHQLAASQALINAHIDHFSYFTCNLSSSNGFFVSYSYGQLPFDKQKDSVYGLGFKFDLGNWNK